MLEAKIEEVDQDFTQATRRLFPVAGTTEFEGKEPLVPQSLTRPCLHLAIFSQLSLEMFSGPERTPLLRCRSCAQAEGYAMLRLRHLGSCSLTFVPRVSQSFSPHRSNGQRRVSTRWLEGFFARCPMALAPKPSRLTKHCAPCGTTLQESGAAWALLRVPKATGHLCTVSSDIIRPLFVHSLRRLTAHTL